AGRSDGRLSVLHRAGPRGLGLSYVEGMQWALGTDATAICQMDADLSHDPADVPRLAAQTAGADLVIGSRYVPDGRIENWPKRRVLMSAFANRYVRAILGLTVTDCTSGFRCWRREALERLPLDRIRSNGYAFQVEMTWEALAAGCRVVEVPITFVERQQGSSKLSSAVIVEAAILPWRLALRRRR
ncbi:MAG: polyprenol monophosphomannose synthase, partial [Acidobacteria bacterium]|nr:polyprenol monophosphomannose synthase [Acidobacteriota bacterium]